MESGRPQKRRAQQQALGVDDLMRGRVQASRGFNDEAGAHRQRHVGSAIGTGSVFGK